MKQNNVFSLYDLLGWQGGTIHQLSDCFGVSSNDLVYGEPDNTIGIDSDWMLGQFAYDTCSKEFVMRELFARYRGVKDFWLGYMHASNRHNTET